MPRLILAALAFLILAAAPARAQLTIEIVGGAGTTIPIAIVPFENEATWPLGVSGIVAADLQRSGLFRQVSDAGIVPRPTRAEDVKLGDFRARGADAVVVGSMRPQADGRVEVRFALLDVVKPKPEARYVMFYCADPMSMDARDLYYESIDMDDALHPQTLLAYDLNDAALPVPNGAPIRLRVERQLGYKHAKYVTGIELVASFDKIRGGKGGYWEDQGYQWFAGI